MADQTTLMGLLKTPSQIRKESQERLMQESLARSQQMLTRGGTTALPGIISAYGAQAAQRGSQAGAGLLRGVAGGIGQAVGGDMGQRISALGVPVEERQAREQQKIVQSINYDNAESIIKAATELQNSNPQAAEVLMRKAKQVQELNKEARKIENATKFLTTRGFTDLAEAVSIGAIPATEAIKSATQDKEDEVKVVGKSLVNTKTGDVVYSEPDKPGESFEMLTSKEVSDLNLPSGASYQRNKSTGEVKPIKGGSVQAQFGAIPKDYRLVTNYNKEGSPSFSMEVIPGSPTAKAQEDAAKRTRAGAVGKADKVDLMSNTINEAVTLLEDDPDIADWQGAAVRVFGDLSGGILKANTKTAVLDGFLTTIKANIGFDKLQRMRDESPTGGALGQVAIQELIALQSSIASLDPLVGPDQLKENLKTIKDTYDREMENLANNYSDDVLRKYGIPHAIQYRTITEEGEVTQSSELADPLGLRKRN